MHSIHDGGALLAALRSLVKTVEQHTKPPDSYLLFKRIGGLRPNHVTGTAMVVPDAPDASKTRDVAPCEEAQRNEAHEEHIWTRMQKIAPWVAPHGGSSTAESRGMPQGDSMRARGNYEWVLPTWVGEHSAECMAGAACRMKHTNGSSHLCGCLFCNASVHPECLTPQQGGFPFSGPASSDRRVLGTNMFVCACCEIEDEHVYLHLRGVAERSLPTGNKLAAAVDLTGGSSTRVECYSERAADDLAELVRSADSRDPWITDEDEALTEPALDGDGTPSLKETHSMPLLYRDVRPPWEFSGTKKQRALNKLARWKALLPRPQVPAPPVLVAAGMAQLPFTFCAEVWFDAWSRNMSAHEINWPVTHVKLQVMEQDGDEHLSVGELSVAVTEPDERHVDRALQVAIMCVPSLLTKPPSSKFYVTAIACNIAGDSEATTLQVERSQVQRGASFHQQLPLPPPKPPPMAMQLPPAVGASTLTHSMQQQQQQQQQLQSEIQNLYAQSMQSAPVLGQMTEEQMTEVMQHMVQQQMQQVLEQQMQQLLPGTGGGQQLSVDALQQALAMGGGMQDPHAALMELAQHAPASAKRPVRNGMTAQAQAKKQKKQNQAA